MVCAVSKIFSKWLSDSNAAQGLNVSASCNLRYLAGFILNEAKAP